MAIYGAMIAAALLRIGAGVLPHAYMVVIGAAGAAWIAAFALCLLEYAPMLHWPAPVGKQSSPAATFRTTSLTWRKARPGTPQYTNDSLLCDVGGRVSRKAGSDIKLIKSTPPSVS